jgi:hypothetical protein
MFLILLVQIQLQSNKVSIVEHMLVSLLGYDQLYLLVQSVGNLIEIGQRDGLLEVDQMRHSF